MCYIYSLVPTPNVIVTALNNQQVGDPRLLECNVTTVRGITSSVDIVWITNDEVVRRVNDISGETVDNSTVYKDRYNIQRSLLKNNTVYYCQVIVKANQLVSTEAFYRIGKQSREDDTVLLYNTYMLICSCLHEVYIGAV